MKDRIILHCDINNFFASVECSKNPALKNFPIAVSGNPKKRNGIILAKNYLAKAFGVSTGEPIWQAKVKCPSLICVEPHMKLYEEVSKDIFEKIYMSYTDKIESFGIDECWLDVTQSKKLFSSPEILAKEIRERIKNEYGITASIGISFCKLFAKLGSDMKKPNATTIISREDYKRIIYPLPIGEILGVGPRMEKHLRKLNINTLGELARADNKVLKTKYGKTMTSLKDKLLGNDFDEVKSVFSHEPPKSVGNGTTTIRDLTTFQELKEVIDYLSEHVSVRLRQKHLLSTNISVSIKDNKLHTIHRERKIPYETNTATDISKEAYDLATAFWDFSLPVRAVRVRASGLKSEVGQHQLSIFDPNEQKKSNLNSGLDSILKKYGDNAINISSYKSSDFINMKLIQDD